MLFDVQSTTMLYRPSDMKSALYRFNFLFLLGNWFLFIHPVTDNTQIQRSGSNGAVPQWRYCTMMCGKRRIQTQWLKLKKVAIEVNRKIIKSFSGLFYFCQHSAIPGWGARTFPLDCAVEAIGWIPSNALSWGIGFLTIVDLCFSCFCMYLRKRNWF